jgi:hypothetical protein
MKKYLTPIITVIDIKDDIVTASSFADGQGDYGEDIFDRG